MLKTSRYLLNLSFVYVVCKINVFRKLPEEMNQISRQALAL